VTYRRAGALRASQRWPKPSMARMRHALESHTGSETPNLRCPMSLGYATDLDRDQCVVESIAAILSNRPIAARWWHSETGVSFHRRP
jgi:hypothetical protein